MFWPLGIDLPNDIKFAAALDKLRKTRGKYAHTYDPSDHIAPEIAMVTVTDCVDAIEDLKYVLNWECFSEFRSKQRLRLLNLLLKRP